NGSKIRVYYLLKALAVRHEVTVLAFHPERDAPAAPSDLEHVRVVPVPTDPFRFVRAPQWVRFASPIPLAYWPQRAMCRAVAALARERSYDAVVAVQPPTARYVLALPGIPRVLEIDTALCTQLRERYARQRGGLSGVRAWASWRKAELYERRHFRRFDACTLVSPTEAAHVRRLLHGSATALEVIPNGVDCTRNTPAYAATPHTLVYNGALTYSANYDAMAWFLAEVYPLIVRAVPDVTLTITGSTRGVDLAGLALDPSVRLSGYVDDIRPVVDSASVCVVPLREGGGTRLKILEAMALGTPVVSTTKGAEGLALRAGEHMLLADTPAAFAEHTVRLLQRPEVGEQMAARARAHVEAHYDWTPIGQRFVDLVEQVVAARRATPGAPHV
ncbi:MAG: glycosyltransferase, partial [Chloroflexi bacterium]|nr:glycosyltransferase [Chloroflexota bacterium]